MRINTVFCWFLLAASADVIADPVANIEENAGDLIGVLFLIWCLASVVGIVLAMANENAEVKKHREQMTFINLRKKLTATKESTPRKPFRNWQTK